MMRSVVLSMLPSLERGNLAQATTGRTGCADEFPVAHMRSSQRAHSLRPGDALSIPLAIRQGEAHTPNRPRRHYKATGFNFILP